MASLEYARMCDECGTMSTDYVADGWIMVKGGLYAYTGRKGDGSAQCERTVSEGKELIFCCWECLTKGRFDTTPRWSKSLKPAADALIRTTSPTAAHIRASIIELNRAIDDLLSRLPLPEPERAEPQLSPEPADEKRN